MTKLIFLIFLIITSCGLNKTDDFDFVYKISRIDKKILRSSDEFKMILTLQNPDSETKELTFFKDLTASVQIWSFWYCDSQIQHAQPRIFKQEPDRTDKYLIKLKQGDSISFDLIGKFLIENDTLKIVFDKYNEILYLPRIDCDSILTCKISGMWMPGRPYVADSYEYYFNSNTLTIDLHDND